MGKIFAGEGPTGFFFRWRIFFFRVEFAKFCRKLKTRRFAESSRNFSDVDFSVEAGWEKFLRAKVRLDPC